MHRTRTWIFLVLLAAGCGGGGGGSAVPIAPPPGPPPGPLTVDAGADQAIAFHEAAALAATVSDDAAPVQWSQLAGPGTTSFENANQKVTRAAFSAAGTYTLRIETTNGVDVFADQCDVSVGAPVGSLLGVDSNVTYQTMRGWEATAWAGQDHPDFDLTDDLILDAAVECGINRLRLEVRAGAENDQDYWSQLQSGSITYDQWDAVRYSNVNDNDDPDVINNAGFHWSELDDTVDRVVTPMRNRIEANGEELWINLCYVAFTGANGAGTQYVHDDAEEYAEFVEATYLHLDNTYGWVPDSWEIILEPDQVSQWSGTTVGNAIVSAAARLQSHGYTPRFVAPSASKVDRSITYFDDLVAVNGAIDHVIEFSYHRYGGATDANLQSIRSRAQTHGIDTSHLEKIGVTYQDLHKDLTLANNSAWAQYALGEPGTGANDSGGLYFFGDTTDPQNPTLVVGSRTKFLRQYFKYVRRDAVRIDVGSAGPFEPLAFDNADGRMVVVVKASSGGTFTITGLSAGTYGAKFTTSAQYDVDLADMEIIDGQALMSSIPAAGVITVYAK